MRVKALIVIAVITLSVLAGLLVAARPVSGAFTSPLYIPLMVSGPRSKIGIAPGGYITGDLQLLNAAWSYRWNNEVYSDTVEWVDMIWGARYMDVPIRSGVILGFNEPDLFSQANLDPMTAAQLWRQIELRYPDKRLISPAPSQFDPDWLWQMVDEYKALYHMRPRFDGVAVHYYRFSDDMPLVSEYVGSVYYVALVYGYDVPLWLTEIGACGANEAETFRDMVDFVESTPWIERAAWYKLRADGYDPETCSTLIGADGALTEIGKLYREIQ